MYVLQLNDMRASNIENVQPRFRADTPEELEAFMQAEKVEPYREDNWAKIFRKDGPLEWCNLPFNFDQHIIDVGNADEWAENARRQYDEQVMSILLLPA
jgi:hypothetical protein